MTAGAIGGDRPIKPRLVAIAPLHRAKIIAKATVIATPLSKVGVMTAHPFPPAPDGGRPDLDYAEHEATYVHFLQSVKYAVVGVVVLLAALAFTLT